MMPKRHVAEFSELTRNEMDGLAERLERIAKAVREATKCEGYNIVLNNGKAAGQIIFHVHFHIIPRFSGDHLSIKWPRPHRYEPGEMQAYAERIAAYLK